MEEGQGRDIMGLLAVDRNMAPHILRVFSLTLSQKAKRQGLAI